MFPVAAGCWEDGPFVVSGATAGVRTRAGGQVGRWSPLLILVVVLPVAVVLSRPRAAAAGGRSSHLARPLALPAPRGPLALARPQRG